MPPRAKKDKSDAPKTKGGKVAKTKAPKEKKGKDPDAPKRSSGAYMFFSKEKRADVKKAHPDFKNTEIIKRLGELWGEMTDAEKKPFQDMADADKARYTKEMAEYKKKKAAEEEEGGDDKEEGEGEAEDKADADGDADDKEGEGEADGEDDE